VNGINGSAPKINLGLSVGAIMLLIFGIIVGGFFIQETKKTADDARNIAAEFDKKVSTFIENWQKRVQTSNKINNGTQQKLLNITQLGTEQEKQLLSLQKNASKILDLQLINENQLKENLTKHRIIANQTRDRVIELQNDTQTLIKQFNQTNEDQRTKAVSNILEGVQHIIGQLDEKQKQAVANLTAQHDDILNIIKNNTK